MLERGIEILQFNRVRVRSTILSWRTKVIVDHSEGFQQIEADAFDHIKADVLIKMDKQTRLYRL